MKTIAIFGANGYIGRHLTAHFSKLGWPCDTFDVQDVAAIEVGNYCQCDVTQKRFWKSFDFRRYDAIVFLAGLSGPERSFREVEKYLMINEGGLINLLELLAPMGADAPKVIFPSSRLVYRGGCRVTEDSPVEPRSVYAANKLACEGLLSAYHYRFGVPYTVLRICVPFGNLLDSTYSYGTIGIFVNQVLRGEAITVYGDGGNSKTYTFIGDICEVFARVVESDAQGVFNVGGHDYTLLQVAQHVQKKYGGEIKLVPWPQEALKVEMGSISLCADKLAAAIGFSEYKIMV